ncbi:hypothetical protein J4Q44_G00340620 [Coregonus suidteri]|uniref:EB1 C-terminal domain-containing protein n=1 Tax=Coregonus suidteri TaxID=861788 RepID=A0AAN8KY75_9TELE
MNAALRIRVDESGPQRTSPTVTKTAHAHPRQINSAPNRRVTPTRANGASDAEILELNQQMLDLKLLVDGLKKERDFYFSKLRDIELICQENETNVSPTLSKIMDILYATEGEDGFMVPEDDKVEEAPTGFTPHSSLSLQHSPPPFSVRHSTHLFSLHHQEEY